MNEALIAGALGVTGRAAVNYLTSLGDWEVIGLSRRSPEFQTWAKYNDSLSTLDLSSPQRTPKNTEDRIRGQNYYLSAEAQA